MDTDSTRLRSCLHFKLARSVVGLALSLAAGHIAALEPPPLLWEMPIPSACDSSPAVADSGTVYFGTFAGDLWAVTPDGKKKWKFTARNEIWSSPAIGADGTIYFGCRDRRLYALDAAGRAKWKFKTGAWVDASPAIGSDGAIYVGSRDGNFYAVTPQGKEAWRFATKGPIVSSALISTAGIIYFGSHDGWLYALSREGKKLWDYSTGAPILSSPAVDAAGRVYITSVSGHLYAVDSGGKLAWKLKTGSVGISSPVIGRDQKIFVGLNDEYWGVTTEGKRAWLRGKDPVGGTPAVMSDGTIIFYFRLGQLVGCDHDLAGPQWIDGVAYSGASSLGVGPGQFYVLSDRFLRAYKWEPPLAATPWPKFRGNARNTGNQADLPR